MVLAPSLVLAALVLSEAAPQDRDLVAELAAAVDLPLPEERRAAAEALAADESVTLADWLAAATAFPCRGEVTTGMRIEEVQLHAEGELEVTPIALHVLV